MKEKVLKVLRDHHLEDFAEGLLVGLIRTKRSLLGTDRKIVEKYFRDHTIRKLHIGCGSHALQGWLNSDHRPHANSILRLDAAKPFPFENDVFDYVFSEHMIEHITYPQGLQMLSECYRVLKPGGRIRIATPDLSFLVRLYGDDTSDLLEEYIRHATDKRIADAPCYEATFVINNYVYSWGHKFIYDEVVLRHSLERVGFTEILKGELGESEDEELGNLENLGRMPEAFLKMETFVLEGSKPY